MKNYNTFGVMIDMSRNAVMSLDSLKRFFPLLKKMGYNCVFLYTEDTYEVDGEPYFGYMRGRYSKAELKEIDDLGASMGIEVIHAHSKRCGIECQRMIYFKPCNTEPHHYIGHRMGFRE